MPNQTLKIIFEGRELTGEPGDTVAHILLSNDIWQFGNFNPARGPFCNMGVCYDCQLYIHSSTTDIPRPMRSCVTLAENDMQLSRFNDDSG